MITLLVDEAYAFDFLAIYQVKCDKYPSEKNTENLKKCSKHLSDQLGMKKFNEIINSDEYKNLVEANSITFDWVDKAKTDSCKASDVDRSNYERCKARNELQSKFFKTGITETKIGYHIYDKQTDN